LQLSLRLAGANSERKEQYRLATIGVLVAALAAPARAAAHGARLEFAAPD